MARRGAKPGFYDGIALSTLYAWRAEFSEFSEATTRGKEVADDAVEFAMWRRATGYSHGSRTGFGRDIVDLANRWEPEWRRHPDAVDCVSEFLAAERDGLAA